MLAYFASGGVSNAGTVACNLLIDNARRLSHGFRTFDHYWIRILLAASRARRSDRTMHRSEEP